MTNENVIEQKELRITCMIKIILTLSIIILLLEYSNIELEIKSKENFWNMMVGVDEGELEQWGHFVSHIIK